jgi:CCR4-NOT transcription complex subunit 9
MDNSASDIETLVRELVAPLTRENALLELSKKREAFPELAPYLWYSFGTIAALLQEIVSIYPLLSPPALTAHASNRVCNALALLQCVASHQDTRSMFLQGDTVFFLRSLSSPGLSWRRSRSSLDLFDPCTCSAHPPLPVPVPQHF